MLNIYRTPKKVVVHFSLPTPLFSPPSAISPLNLPSSPFACSTILFQLQKTPFMHSLICRFAVDDDIVATTIESLLFVLIHTAGKIFLQPINNSMQSLSPPTSIPTASASIPSSFHLLCIAITAKRRNR